MKKISLTLLVVGLATFTSYAQRSRMPRQTIEERVEKITEKAMAENLVQPEQIEQFAEIYERFYTSVDSMRENQVGRMDRSKLVPIYQTRNTALEQVIGKENTDKLKEVELQMMQERRKRMQERRNNRN